MQRLLIVSILVLGICCVFSQGCCAPTPTPFPPTMTTVFVVRHAEYCIPGVDPDCNPGDPDPELGAVGQARAQQLVQVLGKANVEAIYSTETNRTLGTIRPLSDTLHVDFSIYSDVQQLANEVLSDHTGGAVLIAGHEPTVRMIVDALGGQGERCAITTGEFDNLCMVSIHESGTVNAVRLQYGKSSLPDSGRGENTTIKIREGTINGSELATIKSLVPASVRTGAHAVAYFQLPAPLQVTPGSPYVIEWVLPGQAILVWMTLEGNPYPGGTAFGCTGLPVAADDFVFTTYGALAPLTVDQVSAGETGLGSGCGTTSSGSLYQSFTPSAPTLAAVDLRLRAGGDFPTEPGFDMTTVFLVHHAENADDALTIAGRARAEQLAHVMVKSGVSAVYASTAVRTQQTVGRLADLAGLELHTYTEGPTLALEILSEHTGEVILVAAHQPSVPEIIDLLGGDGGACDIGPEYDNLCVLTIHGDGARDVINLQYGAASP